MVYINRALFLDINETAELFKCIAFLDTWLVERRVYMVYGMKWKWDKGFKNEPSEICGRQPLKNLK